MCSYNNMIMIATVSISLRFQLRLCKPTLSLLGIDQYKKCKAFTYIIMVVEKQVR